MAYVYILKSVKLNKYYIGCTENFNRRIKEHNNGLVKSTKTLIPLKVTLVQKFDNLSKARKIEKKLKNLKRKDYLDKIVREGIIKMTA